MYSSAFLNCFAPPLHCNLIADDFKLVECIADEPRNQGHWTNWVKANWPMMKTWNCQMSVDAERKANESPKRNREQRTSTSPSGTSTYYALEGSNSWREMMTDHAIMTQ